VSGEPISPFWLDLGERLKAARNAAEITQPQLAERLALTRSSIANAEAGRQRLDAEALASAAAACRCDLTWLITGEQPTEQQPPHLAHRIVAAMKELADAKPTLRFVLAMDDSQNPGKHAVLKANCSEPEAVHTLALALARMTFPPSPSPERNTQ
jgi:transcriptional regulator with XRE-family HTH domain